jgi:hypothetical protein
MDLREAGFQVSLAKRYGPPKGPIRGWVKNCWAWRRRQYLKFTSKCGNGFDKIIMQTVIIPLQGGELGRASQDQDLLGHYDQQLIRSRSIVHEKQTKINVLLLETTQQPGCYLPISRRVTRPNTGSVAIAGLLLLV